MTGADCMRAGKRGAKSPNRMRGFAHPEVLWQHEPLRRTSIISEERHQKFKDRETVMTPDLRLIPGVQRRERIQWRSCQSVTSTWAGRESSSAWISTCRSKAAG